MGETCPECLIVSVGREFAWCPGPQSHHVIISQLLSIRASQYGLLGKPEDQSSELFWDPHLSIGLPVMSPCCYCLFIAEMADDEVFNESISVCLPWSLIPPLYCMFKIRIPHMQKATDQAMSWCPALIARHWGLAPGKSICCACIWGIQPERRV